MLVSVARARQLTHNFTFDANGAANAIFWQWKRMSEKWSKGDVMILESISPHQLHWFNFINREEDTTFNAYIIYFLKRLDSISKTVTCQSYKKCQKCSQGHHVAKWCLIHCKCAATLTYTSGLPARQLNVHDRMPITVLVPFSLIINGLPESAVHTPWLNGFLVQIFFRPTLGICLPTAIKHSALLITFVVRKCNVFGVGIFWFGLTTP